VAVLAFPRAPRAIRTPSAEGTDLGAATAGGVAARFDGIVINTDRPEQLRAWYAAAFGGEVDGDGGPAGLLSLDGVQLIFLPHSDVAGRAKEPNRILITFQVEDARTHAARLERLGSTWIRPVEPEPFGLLGYRRRPRRQLRADRPGRPGERGARAVQARFGRLRVKVDGHGKCGRHDGAPADCSHGPHVEIRMHGAFERSDTLGRIAGCIRRSETPGRIAEPPPRPGSVRVMTSTRLGDTDR
jgi:Glyoxalase-like domain